VSQWIKAQNGKLINLALMPTVEIFSEQAKDGIAYTLRAYKSDYTNATLAVFANKADAEEALDDLFGNLGGEMAFDFTQPVVAEGVKS